VWKIAMVLSGRAGEALLDTYQQERAPHVRGVIQLAVSLGRIIQTTDPAVAAARDCGFREPGSAPLTDAVRLPGLAEGCLWGGKPAGEVLPQVRVRTQDGSVAMLDDVLGDGFVVVGRDALEGLPFVEVGPRGVVDLDGALEGWIARHGTAVVRPDRYVFGVVRDGLDEALRLKLSAP
jgi:3-(3-hydroxy-phenyl)propionate hydroxylase